MRDPKRIDGVLQSISDVWKLFPDLRLGQLLCNLTKEGEDLFYLEDDKLVERLFIFYQERYKASTER